MHDFTVWVFYEKWRKNGDIRYCLLHLIHLSSTRLRRCGRILSGICEPYCLITPDLTMRYCPILILIDYIWYLGIGKACCLTSLESSAGRYGLSPKIIEPMPASVKISSKSALGRRPSMMWVALTPLLAASTAELILGNIPP